MNTASGKLLPLLLLVALAAPVSAGYASMTATPIGTPGANANTHYFFAYNASISGEPLVYTIQNAGVCIYVWSYWLHAPDHTARFNLSYNNHNYSTVKVALSDLGAPDYPTDTFFNGTCSGNDIARNVRVDYQFEWNDPTIASLPGTVMLEAMGGNYDSYGLYDNITGPSGVYKNAYLWYSAVNNTKNVSNTIGMAPLANSPYGMVQARDGFYEFYYGGGYTPPESTTNSSLRGYVNNAYTNATIAAANIYSTQGASVTSNVSTSTGYYKISNMIDGVEALITGSKVGYYTESFTFTPDLATIYTGNISLIPSYIPNKTAIMGITYASWDGSPVSGATVTIENATWSDTYPTAVTGFYIFDNLAGGESYDVSATAPGYSASASYPVTAAAGITTQQNVPLTALFDVTVTAKDGGTGTILQGIPVYFEVSDGQTANSTFGTTTFTVAGGVHTFTATATGYSVGQQQASITSDTSVILLLYNTTTPEPAAIRYIPHTVRLVFVNQLGIPIPSAHVTAVTTESSTPSNWLLDLFGIPSSVGMNTTTLSGSTDSAGSISFAMADVLKYDILVYNSTAGFSKNFTLYPKEDQYTFQINLATTVANLYDVVKWNLTSYDFSATEISMNLTYNDSAMQTTSLIFYVNGTMNLTPIYKKTVTLTNGNGTAGFVVTNTKGSSLSWGFIAENSAFGTITDMMGLTMKGIAGRLIETGWTTELYLWTSYLILFVVAALFSYANIRFGAIILPFVAGGLWWIGWLSISWVLLGSLMALGVLVYINRSEVKTR